MHSPIRTFQQLATVHISNITQTSIALHAAQCCRKHQRKVSQNTGSTTQNHLKYSRGSRLTQGCFDLFGVDVMVDSDGHPWLLEVNSNPALWDTPGVLAQVLYLRQLDLARFLMALLLQVIPEVVSECVDIMLELQYPDADVRSPAALKTFELLAHSLP